jgi:hypothetical protein
MSISDVLVNEPKPSICFAFHCRVYYFTNFIKKLNNMSHERLTRSHYSTTRMDGWRDSACKVRVCSTANNACTKYVYLLEQMFPRVYISRSQWLLARMLGSWVWNPLKAWIAVHLICVCVLCVGSGLATGWSPTQGVLPTVYRIKKLKKQSRFHQGCRAMGGWVVYLGKPEGVHDRCCFSSAFTITCLLGMSWNWGIFTCKQHFCVERKMAMPVSM